MYRKKGPRPKARRQHGGCGRERVEFGTCFWIPLFKQQFISEKTMRRIYGLSRIISGSLWNSSSHKVKKLIKNQTEVNGVTAINYKEHTWRSTSLLCDTAHEITNATTHVFADSVLCLGSMRDEPIDARKNKIKWCSENNRLKDLNRIDGKPTEFEWKILPGDTDCFLLFHETLKTQNQHQDGSCVFFGSHTFVPTRWMCKKQTPVPHSSTEVTSLDAGLRMDGITALDLWDLVIEVFHSSPNETNKTKESR